MKPTYLKDHGHTVINPALPDDDFDAAVRIAQAEFNQHQPEVVVGSVEGRSRRHEYQERRARLVLLCPAWKKWGTAKAVKPENHTSCTAGPTKWSPLPIPKNGQGQTACLPSR